MFADETLEIGFADNGAGVAVTVADQTGDEVFACRTRDRIFACTIDFGNSNNISVVEAGAEVLEQCGQA